MDTEQKSTDEQFRDFISWLPIDIIDNMLNLIAEYGHEGPLIPIKMMEKAIRLEPFARPEFVNKFLIPYLDSLRKLIVDKELTRIGFNIQESVIKECNIFKKSEDGWLIRFKGNKALFLADSIGLKYIAYLITNPNQELSARELYISVNCLPPERIRTDNDKAQLHDKAITTSTSEIELIDHQTVRECKHRLKIIDEELLEAESNNDLSKKESLKKEKQTVQDYLIRATGLSGRIRNVPDEKEKIRKAVSNAINRAKDHIKKSEPVLFEHLHNTIKLGSVICYQPKEPVNWEI